MSKKILGVSIEDIDQASLVIEAKYCKDCGVDSVIASKCSFDSFCTSCGSEKLIKKEVAAIHEIATLTEKTNLTTTCDSCNTYLHKPLTETASSQDGTDFCPVCGNPILFELSTNQSDDDDDMYLDYDDDDDDDETELFDDTSDEYLDEEDASLVISGCGKTSKKSKNKKNYIEDDTEYDIEDSEVLDTSIDDIEDDYDLESETANLNNKLTISLHKILDTEAKIKFERQGSQVLAFLDNNLIGHKNMLSVPAQYMKSLELSAKDQLDIETCLSSNGFEPITVTINTNSVVNKLISKEVTQARLDYKQKLSDETNKLLDKLTQSMTIASYGLNRGFFNQDNPLTASIITEMKKLGFRDADSLVKATFANVGDDYIKVLRDTTLDIASKSDEVRNELAHTLVDIKPRVDYEPDTLVTASMEKDLSTPLTPSNYVPKQETASAENDSQTDSLTKLKQRLITNYTR